MVLNNYWDHWTQLRWNPEHCTLRTSWLLRCWAAERDISVQATLSWWVCILLTSSLALLLATGTDAVAWGRKCSCWPMVHRHCPQDPWTAGQHGETTRGCDSQLDRCHPTWKEKSLVWGQNLVLGGVNIYRESHGTDVVPSLFKNILLFLLSTHAAASREMWESLTLFMLPATKIVLTCLWQPQVCLSCFLNITLASERAGREPLC